MTSDDLPGGTEASGGRADQRRPDAPGPAGLPDPKAARGRRGPATPPRLADNDGNPGLAWNVVGTLGAGIAFWGMVGWGIDRLTHLHHVFLPIGIVLGLAAAIYLVIYQALRR
jgi:hypothetical protein